MRRVIVTNNITLDGVMQSPGRADEDTRGDFPHGGWTGPYNDSVKAKAMGQGMARAADLLFGRRTYEDFFKVWPSRTDNPFTPVLNAATKYVVSGSLNEPLPWQNSILLKGAPAASVARLKATPGNDLVILGSGVLVDALLREHLVDNMTLMIHPLVLGSGQRMFSFEGALARFTLTSSVATTTGVIIATYELRRAP